MARVNKALDEHMAGQPMTKELKQAVRSALEAQGGMIYPGQHLPVERHMPLAKGEKRPNDPNRPRTYQAIWQEKKRAGFAKLPVKDYLNMLALLEMDELA